MRQAITLKYVPSTDTKGSRISASCDAGRVMCGWEARYNSDTNYALATLKLVKKLGWKGHYTLAGTTKGAVAVDHSSEWNEGDTVTVSYDDSRVPLTMHDLAHSEG